MRLSVEVFGAKARELDREPGRDHGLRPSHGSDLCPGPQVPTHGRDDTKYSFPAAFGAAEPRFHAFSPTLNRSGGGDP